MENYAVDYINVHKRAILINATHTSNEDIFSILSPLDIESCVSSLKTNSLTVVILPKGGQEISQLGELLDKHAEVIDGYFISEEFSYIEIGGHFVGGSNGLANVALDVLRRNNISIEYQLLNPSRYSILIDPRKVKKAITMFISELGVRDSMVTIY